MDLKTVRSGQSFVSIGGNSLREPPATSPKRRVLQTSRGKFVFYLIYNVKQPR